MRTSDGTSELDPERDYIKQQLRRFAEFCARLLARAETRDRAEAAIADAEAAAAEITGIPCAMLDRLATESAITALGSVERLRAYAAVTDTRARLAWKKQDHAASTRFGTRAVALYQAILARTPGDRETQAALQALEAEL